MSTNRKNRERPVLRNMVKSQNVPRRNIISVETKLDSASLKKIVDDINDAIEQVNRLVADRNIPYVRIEESRDYFALDKARVLLRSETSDSRVLTKIETEFKESEGNTFLVELYVNDNGYIEIGCAEDADVGATELSNLVLCDREYLSCVLIDIFLDSALFNSYSFLSDLSSKEKRAINQIKVDFLKSVYDDFTSLNSPFYTFNNKRYKYLSMAFFARESEDKIDLSALIDLWERFVRERFDAPQHKEPPIDKQLLSLVDLEQYSNDILNSCHQLSKGAYWLLRIHRAPVNEHIEKWLEAVFGKAEIGSEKIIEFKEFDSVYDLVRDQNITAFKIVVQ